MDKIIERIEREAGLPGLAEALAERLTPTDLQSLLLEVYRQRASRITPARVLAEYEANRFVRPAMVSPVALLRWEQIAYEQLPAGFEALELAPVCPLGTCSAVAGVDQNWSVATVRNTEVVSDVTNVLALECAVRRKALLRQDSKSAEGVHLAASQRLLRGQKFSEPRQVPHFSLFGLCSAGRDPGGLGFELETLKLHAGYYLEALKAYLGEKVPLRLLVTVLNADVRDEHIEEQVFTPMRGEHPGVDYGFDPERQSGRSYYRAVCFHIYAADGAGESIELADGGAVDWTQKLLSSAKERLFISGIGSERVVGEFAAR